MAVNEWRTQSSSKQLRCAAAPLRRCTTLRCAHLHSHGALAELQRGLRLALIDW
ncbi:MAG: hypothetical protein ACK4ZJ_20105 [Allorhizobium sp.]